MLAVICSSGSVRQPTHIASLALHYNVKYGGGGLLQFSRSLPSEGIDHAGIQGIREAEKFSTQRRAEGTQHCTGHRQGVQRSRSTIITIPAKRTFSQISAHYGKHVFFALLD